MYSFIDNEFLLFSDDIMVMTFLRTTT